MFEQYYYNLANVKIDFGELPLISELKGLKKLKYRNNNIDLETSKG